MMSFDPMKYHAEAWDVRTITGIAVAMRSLGKAIIENTAASIKARVEARNISATDDAKKSIGLRLKDEIKIPMSAKLLIGQVALLREAIAEKSVGDSGRAAKKALLIAERNLWLVLWPARNVPMWMSDAQADRCEKLLSDAADEIEVEGETASQEWITSAQACKIMDISAPHLSTLCNDGTIRSFGTRKARRIDANTLVHWLSDGRDKKTDVTSASDDAQANREAKQTATKELKAMATSGELFEDRMKRIDSITNKVRNKAGP